jgi:hypothetical protein
MARSETQSGLGQDARKIEPHQTSYDAEDFGSARHHAPAASSRNGANTALGSRRNSTIDMPPPVGNPKGGLPQKRKDE